MWTRSVLRAAHLHLRPALAIDSPDPGISAASPAQRITDQFIEAPSTDSDAQWLENGPDAG
eukprot:CAMPEP_0173199858 /NCGR_PEP_ID=MMETSP1141-20130122/17467_1 /TAXON_ID=483371 /ORGANISM="non described non described, Strain CCMP2298" /LENGTH=60 /DNA_ID=CAMNT_0014124791 /DNA_START=429 /DNA_END=612 /DNA_ORIENTATION=-